MLPSLTASTLLRAALSDRYTEATPLAYSISLVPSQAVQVALVCSEWSPAVMLPPHTQWVCAAASEPSVPFAEARVGSLPSPVSSTAFIAASLCRAVSLSPSPAPWSEPCSVAVVTNAVAVPLPTASDCAASAAVGTNCVTMHRASRILRNRFFIASSSFGVGPSSTLSPEGLLLAPPRDLAQREGSLACPSALPGVRTRKRKTRLGKSLGRVQSMGGASLLVHRFSSTATGCHSPKTLDPYGFVPPPFDGFT